MPQPLTAEALDGFRAQGASAARQFALKGDPAKFLDWIVDLRAAIIDRFIGAGVAQQLAVDVVIAFECSARAEFWRLCAAGATDSAGHRLQ